MHTETRATDPSLSGWDLEGPIVNDRIVHTCPQLM